jgi:hypothetical protein
MQSYRLTRLGSMLLALLAVFAFGAITAAAAQAEEAPFWSREGVRLQQNETHYITAKAWSSNFTLTAGTKTITCEKVRLAEGVLLGSSTENPGTNDEIIEFFGNCKVTNNGASCKVKEPIRTNNVKSELVESEKSATASLLVEFRPATGVKFVTISFEGTCTVNETAVEGSVAGQVFTLGATQPELGELVKLPNGKKEAKSWLINFPATPVKSVWLVKEGTGKTESVGLKAFSEEAVLKGTALVLLAHKNSSGEYISEEVNWSPLP